MAQPARVINMDDHRTDGPQVENGFVRVANELEDAILLKIRTFRHSQVVRAIIRKTYGYGKKEDDITISQIAEMTGLHRNHVGKSVTELEAMRVLNPVRAGKHGLIIGLNKHHQQWIADEVKPRGSSTKLVAAEANQNGCSEQPKQLILATKTVENSNQNVAHNRQPQKTTPKDNSKRDVATAAVAPESSGEFGAIEMVASLPNLSKSVAADYLKYRKAMKKPLNATAWGTIAKQVVLSGWTPDDAIAEAMAAGWQGVKAEWLANRKAGAPAAAARPAPAADNFAAKDYGMGGRI